MDGLRDALRAKIDRLPERPRAYRKGRVAGTREMVVGRHYVVVYRETPQAIRILRVQRCARGEAAGLGTDTLPGSALLYLPLRAPMRIRGVLAIEPADAQRLLLPEQRRLLDTCASLVALGADAAGLAPLGTGLLVVGLLISIIMMGVLGGLLAKLLDRWRWIAYLGVFLILYVGLQLLWEGLVSANLVLNLGLPLPLPAEGHS